MIWITFTCFTLTISLALISATKDSEFINHKNEAHQAGLRNIDLNLEYDPLQSPNRSPMALNDDQSLVQAAPERSQREYVYKPREPKEGYSQSYVARNDRENKQKMRETDMKKFQEKLAKKRKRNEGYRERFKELTKIHGRSIRKHDLILADMRKREKLGLINDDEKARLARIRLQKNSPNQGGKRLKLISDARKAVREDIATDEQKALVKKLNDASVEYQRKKRERLRELNIHT